MFKNTPFGDRMNSDIECTIQLGRAIAPQNSFKSIPPMGLATTSLSLQLKSLDVAIVLDLNHAYIA